MAVQKPLKSDWKLFKNELDNGIDFEPGGGAALLEDFAPAADDVVAEGIAEEEVSPPRRDRLACDAVMAARLHPEIEVRPPLTRIPSKYYAHAKRAMDIICALLAIIVLSPLLLACAVAVKATSSGPVFFRQERWGRSKSHFQCWKFRTMVVETPPNLPAQSFGDKARYMTPAGDFLRRWSLDELPQLLNILRGDMSVIGPRPVIIREKHLIDLREPLNANGVRPGLTGWAQINGRNLVNDEEKAFLDGEYVANMSLAFDAQIFFKTVLVVISRRGVDRDRK